MTRTDAKARWRRAEKDRQESSKICRKKVDGAMPGLRLTGALGSAGDPIVRPGAFAFAGTAGAPTNGSVLTPPRQHSVAPGTILERRSLDIAGLLDVVRAVRLTASILKFRAPRWAPAN